MLCGMYTVVSLLFFFFKQKTAYDVRISDWSSDVCSSDLRDRKVLLKILRHAFGHSNDMLRPGIGRPHQHLSQHRTGTFVQMGRGVDPFADNAGRFSAPRRRHIGKIGPGEEAQRRIGLKPGYQPAYCPDAWEQTPTAIELDGIDPPRRRISCKIGRAHV